MKAPIRSQSRSYRRCPKSSRNKSCVFIRPLNVTVRTACTAILSIATGLGRAGLIEGRAANYAAEQESGTLHELGLRQHFADVPDQLLRRYARRLANRPSSNGARIK